MSGSITLPAQFGWVIAAVASTAWLNIWQALRVASARKVAKIAYPQAYAEKAEVEKSADAFRFNCAQRAHANTLENLPYVLTLGLIWGLKQPVYSAIALEVWVLIKVWYTVGYTRHGPEGRIAALWPKVPVVFALLGGGSWAAFQFVVDAL